MTASSDENRNESWGIILKEIFNNIDSVLFKTQFLKYFNQYNEHLPHITEIQKKYIEKFGKVSLIALEETVSHYWQHH